MAQSMPHALRRIKEELPRVLNPLRIERICRDVGHRWRDRLLPPARTVYLFVLQILHGNIACSALRHICQEPISASAYCQARARLPLRAVETIVHRVVSGLAAGSDLASQWHGHRVIHIDGSGFSMPDTKALQQHFGQHGRQKEGCGFPIARLCAITHARTGMILDLIASPLRTHDMSGAVTLHAKMKPHDVLVGDRGFCSYAHLALILQGNMHAVLRVHQRQILCFGKRRHAKAKAKRRGAPTSSFVRSLGHEDQVVRWVKPYGRPDWMSLEQFSVLPARIEVRELRYRIRRRGFRTRQVALVTTLLDAARYPVEALSRLYFRRWQIEVNFRHLKQTMGMDVLRCKTVDGVLKELWMFVLVYNLVCTLIAHTAYRQGVPPDRISFIDALRWLRYVSRTGYPRELLVNARREGRFEPRVVKRRPKSHRLMTRPRQELRKSLASQRLIA